MTIRIKLEHAITEWDRRNRNHHAGAIALLRLDDVLAEHEATGRDLRLLIEENFNDRLLTRMLAALPSVL
jgi:hypothetical protein